MTDPAEGFDELEDAYRRALEFVANPPRDFDHGPPFRPGETIAEGSARRANEWRARYLERARSRCCGAPLRVEPIDEMVDAFHCTSCNRRDSP